MKIAIHQPNFLPWMGYFQKIALCDRFVFYDTAEYTQKSFIRRVSIHKENPADELFLTVPLQKHSSFDKICDLHIVPDRIWMARAKAQIHQAYFRAPHYDQLESILDLFFGSELADTSLARYNASLIQHVAKMLTLDVEWLWSSAMSIHTASTKAVIQMIDQLDGTTYISGLGAKRYHDVSLFAEHNIELQYPDFPVCFRETDLPASFLYKSVLSYLAHYDVDQLGSWLRGEGKLQV